MKFNKYDYAQQNFAFSHRPNLNLIGVMHSNWAHRATDDSWQHFAGDLGDSYSSSVGKLKMGAHPRGFNFTEEMSEVSPPPPGYVRPASPDDGGFHYCGANNHNPELRDAFIWSRGNDGQGFTSNIYTRQAYGAVDGADEHNVDVVARMQADGWRMGKLFIYYPDAKGCKILDIENWPCEFNGQNIPHPATKSNSSCRNSTFDPVTNTLFCFYDYNNNLNLVAYRIDSKTIEIYSVGSWWHPDGRRFFLEAFVPPSSAAVVEDGFAYNFPDNGRWYSACNLMWEHCATWVNPEDGKLYAISPQTGYQWCFETRAPKYVPPSGDLWTIPFGPIGKRIPLKNTWPAIESHFTYPPSGAGSDVKMNAFMVPLKGGLLYWTASHYGHGTTGLPNHMCWRRLGNTGEWTPITPPNDFTANACGVKSTYPDNDTVLAISQASTTIPLGNPRYFFLITA